MCITIVNNDYSSAYVPEKTLQQQISNKSEILIDYEPNDASINSFLKELQKYVKNGNDLNIDVKVNCKNYLLAFKLKKEINSLLNDITINKFIKILTTTNYETSKKLKEISSICKGINLNV